MVKNIVFDMGRVLVNYDSKRCCREFIDNSKDQDLVDLCLFASQEWLLLDMGVISEDFALQRILRKLPNRLHHAAGLCMKHWHEYCMWPVDGMGDLIKDLKKKRFGIYLCSNAALRMLQCQDKIPGIEYFDGVLFSAEVKCMKPQKEMYEHLFSRFHLKPEECFFIDDLSINIEGAKACGMDGYCFAEQDVPALYRLLTSFDTPFARAQHQELIFHH